MSSQSPWKLGDAQAEAPPREVAQEADPDRQVAAEAAAAADSPAEAGVEQRHGHLPGSAES